LNTEKKWIGIKEEDEDGRIKFSVKVKFIRMDEDQLHVKITKKEGQLCEWYPVLTQMMETTLYDTLLLP
jgi:sensor histidine kinase YesM